MDLNHQQIKELDQMYGASFYLLDVNKVRNKLQKNRTCI